MKKTTYFLIALFLVGFSWLSSAQIVNDNAAWGNTAWSLTGTYDVAFLGGDPTTTANFAFDDDAAGSGLDNTVNAESPMIDLTAAFTGGETLLTASFNYALNVCCSQTFKLQYFDADAATWVDWEELVDNGSAADYQACNLSPFTSTELDFSAFTATQQSGFRYRLAYDDATNWAWGFCMDSPTVVSVAPPSCPDVTGLAASNFTAPDSADLSWDAVGAATGYNWEIQPQGTAQGTAGAVAMGSGALTTATATGLVDATNYTLYVQSDCAANGMGNYVSLDFNYLIPPANDNCAGVIDLGTLTSPHTASTVGAVNDFTGLDCLSNAGAPDVVYSVVVPDGFTLDIQQDSNAYDSKHRLAYGATCPGDTLIICRDDPDTTAETFTNTTGADVTAYWVQSAFSTGSGDYTLSWLLTAPPACPDVTGLTVGNFTAPDSADLSWDTAVGATGYNWEIQPQGTAQGTAGAVAMGSGALTTATATGLADTTNYTLYVQSICAAGPGNYISLDFTFVLPIVNDDCTGAITVTCNSTVSGSTTNANSEIIGAFTGDDEDAKSVWYHFTGDGSEVTLSTCNDGGATGGNAAYDTKIDVYSGDCATLVHVGGNDDGGSCSGFSSLFSYTTVVGTEYYIRVYGFSVNSSGDFVLSVDCTTPCSPIAGNDNCVDAETATEGVLIVGENSCQTDAISNPTCDSFGAINDVWYEFTTGSVLKDLGITLDFNDGTYTAQGVNFAIYDTCGGNELICNTSSVSGVENIITGASINTNYKIQVWTGDNETGTFALTIAELCTAVNTPYYNEDFVSFSDKCWTESNQSVGSPSNNNDSNWREFGWLRNGTTGAAAFNFFAGNDRDWLISPFFDLSGGTYILTVDVGVTHWGNSSYTDMGDDDEVVLKYTEDGTTWNDLMTWNKANQPNNFGRTENVNISNITGANVQFAFWANEGEFQRHSYFFFVDNFIIKDDVCVKPANLMVVNAIAGNAELSWTDGNAGATTYEVQWREALTATWNSAVVSAGVTTYTITGLTSSAEYEWRLLYSCDADAGLPVAGPNFVMDCPAIVPFYTEDFTSYLPNCWREGNGGTDRPANFNDSGWGELGFAHIGATGSAAFNFYNGNDRDWLISPRFDLTGGPYEINVDVAVSHWQHPGSAAMGEDDQVVLKYSLDNGNSWSDLQVWNGGNQPSSTGDTIIVNISALNFNNVMFAFWADEGTSELHSYLFYVDNFVVTPIPQQAPKPQEVVSNIPVVKIGQDANIFKVLSGNDTISSLQVMDMTGKLIYSKNEIHANIHDVSLNVNEGTILVFKIGLNNDTSQRIIKKVYLNR